MNSVLSNPWFESVMLSLVITITFLLYRSYVKQELHRAWEEWRKAAIIAKIGHDGLMEIARSATADVATVEYAQSVLRDIDQIAGIDVHAA